MRSHFLPFAMPELDDMELSQVKSALESGWITSGPRTRQFEQEFAAAVGARHALAVNSCTAAMHLVLEAIDLKPGDLVLTTPYTFAATAAVIRYFDAAPVFVDVEPETFNMDTRQLAEVTAALKSMSSSAAIFLPPALRHSAERGKLGSLKAIVPVHMAGNPCDLDAIYGIAHWHDVPVIEDAAHAYPCRYKKRPIGCSVNHSVRSAVCFSFHAAMTLTTGEGGMLCTADDAIAERCRTMAFHGISQGSRKGGPAEGSRRCEITAPGYKYSMTDLAAGIGLAQLNKAARMLKRRADIARQYTEAFRTVPQLQVPFEGADVQHAWHLYMLRLHLDRLCIDRADFVEELRQRRIGAAVHFMPLHMQPYYRQKYGYRPEDFPLACREYLREVSLPIYSKMNDEDVACVIQAVKDIVARNSK